MTAKKSTRPTKSNNEINANGQDVSILIVDDHPAMRSTMYDILEDEGLSPMVAANGGEAISLCMENDFVHIQGFLQKGYGPQSVALLL